MLEHYVTQKKIPLINYVIGNKKRKKNFEKNQDSLEWEGCTHVIKRHQNAFSKKVDDQFQ